MENPTQAINNTAAAKIQGAQALSLLCFLFIIASKRLLSFYNEQMTVFSSKTLMLPETT
ncbi:MAG: hypothetical protein PHT88_03895 [Candidatus Moranbacteria bacterium]|nr:hypothetical protein [Candidatus Moranbacteria bacterium]